MTKEEAKEYILECLDRSEAEEIIEALDQKSCEDAVSRADLIDKLEIIDKSYGSDFYWEVRKIVDSLPPVKPVACIATVKFNKEDMQKIVDEKVKEIMAGDRVTCKDCKHNAKNGCGMGHRFYMREPSTFYCADGEREEVKDNRS